VLGGGGQIEADPALTRANAAAGKSK
jgi:hypothetical protein